MIRQDPISISLSVLAVCLPIFFFPDTNSVTVLFPAILTGISITMNHFINRRHYASPRYFDEEISRKERSEIWRWYLLAFTGTFAIYYFVSTEIFVPASLLTLPFIQAVTLSMSQAVAEEQFFRGFLLDYIYDRLKSSTIVKLPSLQLIPSIIGGSIFTVYHYWRYSLHPDVMMYIFFTGILMSWICLKSRRLSPVLLSHVLVNLIATSMQGG